MTNHHSIDQHCDHCGKYMGSADAFNFKPREGKDRFCSRACEKAYVPKPRQKLARSALPLASSTTLNMSLSVVSREVPVVQKARCEVGNIYPAKGGRGARYFVIVSVRKGMAHALGFDDEGQLITTTSYGVSAFEDRRVLGRVKNLQSFLEAEWFEEN